VPASAVPNPNDLAIECSVNGERRQSGRTSEMIFSCAYLVSYLSRYMTLKPGDLIFTGTPAGPILGHPEKDRKWLKPGDIGETRSEGLGTLRFTLT
jgi:2-keto-4-pentenoate hydratase/2-oxohepta-3-ene-1,7-dioic acid hydratase in catechol pathway